MEFANNCAFQVFSIRNDILRVEEGSTVDPPYVIILEYVARVEDGVIDDFRIELKVKKGKLHVCLSVVVAGVIFGQQALVEHDPDCCGAYKNAVYLGGVVS